MTNITYNNTINGVLIGNINQTINGLSDKPEQAALTDALKQLGETLKQALPLMPGDAAEQALRNYDDLAKEASSPKPRGGIARALTSDLAETVKSVAEFGKPIAELCVAIAALFA